jgi:hypothetical protein
MAWEKRGARTYFYRSVRCDGKVKKLYYGSGPTGRLAANADALRRAERVAAEQALRAAKDQLNEAVRLTHELNRCCDLLAAAMLLAAGFHRPGRHTWRRWRNGRRTLHASAGACGGDGAAGARVPSPGG